MLLVVIHFLLLVGMASSLVAMVSNLVNLEDTMLGWTILAIFYLVRLSMRPYRQSSLCMTI